MTGICIKHYKYKKHNAVTNLYTSWYRLQNFIHMGQGATYSPWSDRLLISLICPESSCLNIINIQSCIECARNVRSWVVLCCFGDIQCKRPLTYDNQTTYHCILETIQDFFYRPQITPCATTYPLRPCHLRWPTSLDAYKRYVEKIINPKQIPPSKWFSTLMNIGN